MIESFFSASSSTGDRNYVERTNASFLAAATAIPARKSMPDVAAAAAAKTAGAA